jgi:outer membrane protein assembly factor BamE
MRKLLIFITVSATLLSAGCGSLSSVADAIPNALDRAPLIYRPAIQQGNVVTQDQVNELQPGMTKRQVRYVLGSPMLTDVFHADRWDYAYTTGTGSRPEEIRRVTVIFEEDRLVRIAGDLRPQPEDERAEKVQEVVITVPDWVPKDRSLWQRTQELVGLEPDYD